MAIDIAYRKELARVVLSAGRTPLDDLREVPAAMLAAVPALRAAAGPGIEFPAGLAPVPQPLTPAPAPGAPLPRADVVVITWTVAERDALADVFTPGFPGAVWHRGIATTAAISSSTMSGFATGRRRSAPRSSAATS